MSFQSTTVTAARKIPDTRTFWILLCYTLHRQVTVLNCQTTNTVESWWTKTDDLILFTLQSKLQTFGSDFNPLMPAVAIWVQL